ncbi:MAG: hypothetical protein R3E96_10830 [Planctomycetota bacterium]
MHLRLATVEDRPALQDLYTQHLQALASFNPSVQADAPLQDLWFERPGVLFPWLLRKPQPPCSASPCSGGRKLSEAMGSDTDFYLHEFHVAEPFRAKASAAMRCMNFSRSTLDPGPSMCILPTPAPSAFGRWHWPPWN